MIENQRDEQRTLELRKLGIFEDRRSWISFAGHVYLQGYDRSRLRALVREDADGICYVCKNKARFDGDMDHIEGGLGPQRCDCYHTKLANGKKHTNVGWIHGMFSRKACHQKKHHRI